MVALECETAGGTEREIAVMVFRERHLLGKLCLERSDVCLLRAAKVLTGGAKSSSNEKLSG